MSELLQFVAFIDGITADWRESRARKRVARRVARRDRKKTALPKTTVGDLPTFVDDQRAASQYRKLNL